MKKSLIWDYEANSVRGSFVNLVITCVYVCLVISSALFSSVASNVREMETFLIGFFCTSFGIWSGHKSVEMWKTHSLPKSVQDLLDNEAKSPEDKEQEEQTINSENN